MSLAPSDGASGPPAVPPAFGHAIACGARTCGGPALPLYVAPSAGASTSGEAYVANWSAGGVVSVDPADTNHWVAVGTSVADLAVGNGSAYNVSGVVVLGDSYDGGATWSTRVTAPGAGWSDPNSPYCGLRGSLAGDVAVRADGVAVFAEVASPAGPPARTCLTPASGAVVYLGFDAGGTATLSPPLPVTSPSSGSATFPRLAIAPDGSIYLAYDLSNGSGVVRSSSDGGSSWSLPSYLPGTPAGVVALQVNRTGTLYALYSIPGPLSSDSVVLSASADGGATFSSAQTVGVTVPVTSASPAAVYPLLTEPQLAVDRNASSPYAGRLYAVYPNGSGGAPGSPSITLRWSPDGGRSWASSSALDPGSGREDLEPIVAVSPDGVVVVQWYGVDAASGVYRLYATSSHDGGATFRTPFALSQVDSRPPAVVGGTQAFLGDRTDLVAGRTALASIWTDTRSDLSVNRSYWSEGPLAGQYRNTSLWVAGLVPITLSSTLPVTIGIEGGLDAGPTLDLSDAPASVLAASGSTVVVTAPSSVANGSTTSYFASWFGSNYSTNATISLGRVEPTDLVACYEPTVNSPCRAAGAPGFLRIYGDPVDASVLLDGRPFPLSTSGAFETVAPGSHSIVVSDHGFSTFQTSVSVDPGSFLNVTYRLTALPGQVYGTVAPATATIKLDGAVVPVSASGRFAANVTQGNHSVAASAYGYLATSVGPTFVAWDRPWNLTVRLVPVLAQIRGVLSPTNASVLLNGILQPVGADGGFEFGVPVGIYWVNVSEFSYAPSSFGPLAVLPGGVYYVNVTLSRLPGQLEVTVSPVSAIVRVDNGPPSVFPGGRTLLDLPWGTHLVFAGAQGHDEAEATVAVPYGGLVSVELNLPVASGWIDLLVNVPGASVALDIGPALPTHEGSANLTVPPGEHHLAVSADGFAPIGQAVTVYPGRAAIVWLNLSPSGGPEGASLSLGGLLPGLTIDLAVVGAVALVFFYRSRRPGEPSRPDPA